MPNFHADLQGRSQVRGPPACAFIYENTEEVEGRVREGGGGTLLPALVLHTADTVQTTREHSTRAAPFINTGPNSFDMGDNRSNARPSRQKRALFRVAKEFVLQGRAAYKGRIIDEESDLAAITPAAEEILSTVRPKLEKERACEERSSNQGQCKQASKRMG